MVANWALRLNGRQRVVHAVATVLALIIASTMFFGIKAPTAIGGEFDCGPAAYALLAGPERSTTDEGDCQAAAGKRLTTVIGLIALTLVGGHIGVRLSQAPFHDARDRGPVRVHVRDTIPIPPPSQAAPTGHRTRERRSRST